MASTRLRELLERTGDAVNQSLADKLDNAEALRAELRQHLGEPSDAVMAAYLGEKDWVLDSLRRTYVDSQRGASNVLWIASKNGVRADARFKNLLRDLGLVDYFRSSGKWGDFCRPVGQDDFECR